MKEIVNYTGVLPYAIHNNTKYFLLGKEHRQIGWSGSKKWSDFGGDPEDENVLNGAAREFYEESMGIFGDIKEIIILLKKSKIVKVNNGYIFLLKIEYNKNLPILFKRIHNYFSLCSKKSKTKIGYNEIPSCPSGLFEKTDIKWISQNKLLKDIKDNSKIYRKEFINSIQIILS